MPIRRTARPTTHAKLVQTTSITGGLGFRRGQLMGVSPVSATSVVMRAEKAKAPGLIPGRLS